MSQSQSARIWTKQALKSLHQALAEIVSREMADFVVLMRQYGPVESSADDVPVSLASTVTSFHAAIPLVSCGNEWQPSLHLSCRFVGANRLDFRFTHLVALGCSN